MGDPPRTRVPGVLAGRRPPRDRPRWMIRCHARPGAAPGAGGSRGGRPGRTVRSPRMAVTDPGRSKGSTGGRRARRLSTRPASEWADDGPTVARDRALCGHLTRCTGGTADERPDPGIWTALVGPLTRLSGSAAPERVRPRRSGWGRARAGSAAPERVAPHHRRCGFSAMRPRNASRGRVLATWRDSSQPRRAWAVPHRTLSHSVR
jgi:hypothetical protein